MKIFIYFSLILIAVACSQNLNGNLGNDLVNQAVKNTIDSLIEVSDNAYKSVDFKDSLFDVHLLRAYELASEYKLYGTEAELYNKVGKRYRNISEFGIALFFYQKSLEISNQLGDEDLKAHTKNEMAVVFRRIDDNGKALNLHFQALDWAESAKDTFLILAANNGIGNVYLSYHNLPKAIEYFHKSLQFLKDGYANKLSEAINTNNIGEAWLGLGNSDSALYYVQESYRINVEMGSKLGQAICNNGLGDIYVYLKEYHKAIEYYNASLNLNREGGNLKYVAENLQNLGNAHLKLLNYSLAEYYLVKALDISKEMGSKMNIVEIQKNLSILYREEGEKDKALYYLDEAINITDTIIKEVSSLNSEGMSALYKTEKQEREIIILKQKDELSQLSINRQRWFIFGSFIVILGGLVFSIYAIYQRKRTLKFIKQIQEQNTKIKDSIRYAQKIQSAILPHHEQIAEVFHDYFVYFKPRDIVSGDFYWFTKKEDLSIMVTADSTGHGIPGALMSMLGIAFLNEIVNKENIIEPHFILDRLRQQVISQLKQKGNFEDSKDGIELCIYVIDHKTMRLQFAGAYRPLYIIRNKQLTQLKADSMPIGYHPKKIYPFSKQEFELEKGDCLYTSTDGYTDQFGGTEGTKFMVKHYKELLLEVHEKPMVEQEVIIAERMELWRGQYEQIDDIIVIGVRI